MEKHSDYRHFLNRDFQAKKSKNSQYSYRAYARDLGLSSGYLSQVLKAQRTLSFEKAIQLSAILNVTEEQKTEFLAQVRLANAKSTPAKSEILSELAKQQIKAPKFRIHRPESLNLIKSWHYTALLEVFALSDYQSNFKWIAKRFSLSQKMVKEVFHNLELAGLIRKNESGCWGLKDKHNKWPDIPSKAIRKIHKEYIKMAANAIDQQNYTERDITGSVFAISSKQYPKFQKLIAEFRQKAIQLADEEKSPDAVYRLSVQLFRLDKEESNK